MTPIFFSDRSPSVCYNMIPFFCFVVNFVSFFADRLFFFYFFFCDIFSFVGGPNCFIFIFILLFSPVFWRVLTNVFLGVLPYYLFPVRIFVFQSETLFFFVSTRFSIVSGPMYHIPGTYSLFSDEKRRVRLYRALQLEAFQTGTFRAGHLNTVGTYAVPL